MPIKYTFKKRSQFGSFSFVQAAVLLVVVAGCGSSGDTGYVVSGRVTLNGEPLPSGLIRFMPKQQSARIQTVSASAMITEGSFTFPASSRLLAGSYKVAITAEKKTGRRISAEEGSSEMEDELRQYIPLKYNAKTELSAEISGDVDNLEFTLEL